MKILIQLDEHDHIAGVGTPGLFYTAILRNVSFSIEHELAHSRWHGAFHTGRTFMEIRGEVSRESWYDTQPPMPADIPALPDAPKLLEEKTDDEQKK